MLLPQKVPQKPSKRNADFYLHTGFPIPGGLFLYVLNIFSNAQKLKLPGVFEITKYSLPLNKYLIPNQPKPIFIILFKAPVPVF